MNEGTQIFFVSILGFIVTLLTIILVLLRENSKRLRSIDVLTTYIVENLSGVKKDTETLSNILKIYESETKIVQKRKEQEQIKQRFQRQPR